MDQPAYAAARNVAARVETHFARHRAAAEAEGRTDLAPAPSAATIEALINAAFWASLRREEGMLPRISLALVPQELATAPLRFARLLPLSPAALAKLAPAVERPGIHLGVAPDASGDLSVWGTTRWLPAHCFVLEVVASGLLVIKHRSESFGKFVNVAVLEGDEVKIVDETHAHVPDCPGLLQSLLGIESGSDAAERSNVMVQVAASMRAHGRGGALFVIPAANRAWAESVLNPILYAVDPPFAELGDLVRRDPAVRATHEWQDDLKRAIDALAGLTAVDGATLISHGYELIAFGAKIIRRRGNAPVDRLILSEPVEGFVPISIDPYQLGGTRHLSAAQFVSDQPGATALVASQDGRFTILKWSDCDKVVHAHRVEALLL
jgi:hypothetical protein